MELPPQDRSGSMGSRDGWKIWSRRWQGVRPSPKYLEINNFFGLFTAVIYFPEI